MNDQHRHDLNKVPAVTLVFWIIKVAATTLGETGGDAVTMSMNLGYLVGTMIFAGIFLVAVAFQIRAKMYHPLIYWTTIVATTTVGTTLADFADRSLGIGYTGGVLLLFLLLILSLAIWHRTLGTVSVASIRTPQAELFYWITIMFSQTLGTALGDWTATTAGLGYSGGALVFSGLLALVAIAYYRTRISHTVLFWSAFILTRPLGAVVGDFLDKPLNDGGLALSRYTASAALVVFMLFCILVFERKAAAPLIRAMRLEYLGSRRKLPTGCQRGNIMRVLLVEDDRMIGEALRDALKDASYAADWVKNGDMALTALASQRYDLVLLDLGLPGQDGLTVLDTIRRHNNPVPLIIITARDAINDRISGLDTGADDYLVKPFEMSELLARMRAILRRKNEDARLVLSNGLIALDPAARTACVSAAAPIQLSNREFSLLHALMVRPGAISSRGELEDRIYGWGEEVESNAIEFLIHALRKKLGSDVIRNVRGAGWMVAKGD